MSILISVATGRLPSTLGMDYHPSEHRALHAPRVPPKSASRGFLCFKSYQARV